jgi:hypothetical protein
MINNKKKKEKKEEKKEGGERRERGNGKRYFWKGPSMTQIKALLLFVFSFLCISSLYITFLHTSSI